MNRNWPGSIRNAGQGPRASVQPDMSQEEYLKRAFYAGDIPFEVVVAALTAKNLPPQVRNTPYPIINITSDNALSTNNLLLPANPNRMGFTICIIDTSGASTAIPMFSYGPPPMTAGGPIGIPVGLNSNFGEGNGTVSIDDIYIFAQNFDDNNLIALAYESVLAIESHLHLQTRE